MGNKIGYLVEKKKQKKTSLFKLKKKNKKKQGHRHKSRALVRENVKKIEKKNF